MINSDKAGNMCLESYQDLQQSYLAYNVVT